MELYDLLEKVTDEESFFEFAKALQADKEDESRKEKVNPSNPYSHGWNGWQNSTIDEFLESAIAYTEDSEPWKRESNPWKKFAEFLYGGKIYE